MLTPILLLVDIGWLMQNYLEVDVDVVERRIATAFG